MAKIRPTYTIRDYGDAFDILVNDQQIVASNKRRDYESDKDYLNMLVAARNLVLGYNLGGQRHT